MSVESAVQSIPTGRGRPPIILKGGKPYKEARDEAKLEVRNAKAALSAANKGLKDAVRAVAQGEKVVARLEASLAKFADKPLADKAAQKERVADTKSALKDAKSALRGYIKDQKASTSDVNAATKTLAKAEAGLAKVEAAKAALKPN